MMGQKNPHDVRGMRIDCPDFEQCALCYGCRAFSSKYLKCLECKSENEKKNICRTDKHRADLVEKMVTKECIKLN